MGPCSASGAANPRGVVREGPDDTCATAPCTPHCNCNHHMKYYQYTLLNIITICYIIIVIIYIYTHAHTYNDLLRVATLIEHMNSTGVSSISCCAAEKVPGSQSFPDVPSWKRVGGHCKLREAAKVLVCAWWVLDLKSAGLVFEPPLWNIFLKNRQAGDDEVPTDMEP